jgi:exoribonuclease-2
MNAAHPSRRIDLVRIATEVMSERGLQPEFPAGVLQQLSSITGSASDADSRIRDRTALLWCSIDNDDSLDLDQLTFCELLADGAVKILVALSDVDALVKKGSAIDAHARINTTSVYTSAKVFPMLPVRLSNDLTSLNPDQDRLAVVTEMTIAADATIPHATTYRATRASLSPESLSSKWVSVSASSLGLRT